MAVRNDKESLTVGLCDDERHIHDTVEKMLLLYAGRNHIALHIVHYDSAKQLIERKDELDFLLLHHFTINCEKFLRIDGIHRR